MGENLDSDQLNRLWDHRLHVDEQFYSRLSFFLVFESVLLGVVGVLYSKPNTSLLVLKVVIILGLSLTIIWEYSQARHKYILDNLNRQAREIFPEYREILERREKVKWPVTNRQLLTYVVPTLVGLIWIILLLFL